MKAEMVVGGEGGGGDRLTLSSQSLQNHVSTWKSGVDFKNLQRNYFFI